jgi:glutaredoxin
MNNKKIIFSVIGLIVLGVIVAVLINLRKQPVVVSIKYDAFAQCLATKNLTMYGATWCSHCKAQKALFGDSFKYASYVECTENTDLCLQKGIEGYPTWIDASGTKYVGEQSLEKLSSISGCKLPEVK